MVVLPGLLSDPVVRAFVCTSHSSRRRVTLDEPQQVPISGKLTRLRNVQLADAVTVQPLRDRFHDRLTRRDFAANCHKGSRGGGVIIDGLFSRRPRHELPTTPAAASGPEPHHGRRIRIANAESGLPCALVPRDTRAPSPDRPIAGRIFLDGQAVCRCSALAWHGDQSETPLVRLRPFGRRHARSVASLASLAGPAQNVHVCAVSPLCCSTCGQSRHTLAKTITTQELMV